MLVPSVEMILLIRLLEELEIYIISVLNITNIYAEKALAVVGIVNTTSVSAEELEFEIHITRTNDEWDKFENASYHLEFSYIPFQQ